MIDVVSVVADGDDVRRAPQGVIVAVLNQCLKAFGSILSSSKYNQTPLFKHIFSHLAFAFYLIYFLKFFVAFDRVYLRRSFVVDVRRATL